MDTPVATQTLLEWFRLVLIRVEYSTYPPATRTSQHASLKVLGVFDFCLNPGSVTTPPPLSPPILVHHSQTLYHPDQLSLILVRSTRTLVGQPHMTRLYQGVLSFTYIGRATSPTNLHRLSTNSCLIRLIFGSLSSQYSVLLDCIIVYVHERVLKSRFPPSQTTLHYDLCPAQHLQIRHHTRRLFPPISVRLT